MAGAPHDEGDIMKPTIGLYEPLTLFKSSEASTIRFVEKELCSCHLRHALTDNGSIPLYFNDWFSFHHITIPIQIEESIADEKLASFVFDHSKDPLAIFKAKITLP